MDDPVSSDVSDFQEQINRRIARFHTDEHTEEAVRLVIETFEARLLAIRLAPFGQDWARETLARARRDVLQDLDDLLSQQLDADEEENATGWGQSEQ